MRGFMYRVVALAISLSTAAFALGATPALAQSLDDLPDNPGEAPTTVPSLEPTVPKKGYRFNGVAPKTKDRRAFAMEFGFRSRAVTVPKSLLDIWYFDIEDPNWAYIERRPRISGYALGLEWILKSDSANGIFYAEFLDSEMREGYWDDVEEPADHLDGEFIAPSPGLGLVTLGANYAYEAHMIRTRDTQGRFGLSFLVGGGLGIGLMTGRLDRWSADDDGNPSYKRFLDGIPADDDKALPRVYPMVDINAGLRFNFGDRVVFRAEGGLHTLVYFGGSAGVMF